VLGKGIGLLAILVIVASITPVFALTELERASIDNPSLVNAFGAPVGGTLFAYEMSKPNTFWTFDMIWKVFITCSIGVFWL